MKRYFLSLTENCGQQVMTDFDEFGARIVWCSEFLPHLVSIETDRSLEEIKSFFLVETAREEEDGEYNETILDREISNVKI